MVAIPEKPQLTQEQAMQALQSWYGDQQQLRELRNKEMVERKSLFAYFFPSPVEGTNRFALGGGFDLKATQGYTRKVDEDALGAVKQKDAKALKLNLDALFPTKPTLDLSEYRKLNEEQRRFVDTLLDIDEGSPSMEICASVKATTPAVAAAPVPTVPAPPAVPAVPAAPPAPPLFDFAEVAENAKPGQYYHDDGNFWKLDDEYEWVAVEDALLIGQLTVAIAPEPTEIEAKAPTKRGRKAGSTNKAKAKK